MPRLLFPIAVLVAVAASGCGGGSGNTTSRGETDRTAGPPSKADFIEVADAICKNHQSRREDLESQARDLGPITSGAKADRIAALLRKESRNRLAEVRELGGLEAPGANAGRAGAVRAAIRAEARVIRAWANAYGRLDSAAIRSLRVRLGVITARARAAARAFGFQVCGQQ